MQYKYRWYYAVGIFISVITIGIFYFIMPKWNEAEVLRATDEQLSLDLSAVKQFAVQRNENVTIKHLQPEQMAEIAALAHTNGVMVQSIHLLGRQSLEAAPMDTIHLTASGDFIHITQFLFAMIDHFDMSAVTDFLYKAERRDEYLFNLNVILWENGRRQPISHDRLERAVVMHAPFCFNANEIFQQNDADALQQVPLDQIKMIGYLRFGDRVTGIVFLPSGAAFDVQPGTLLGLEQGVVLTVERDHMLIKLPSMQRKLMMAEGGSDVLPV